MALIWHLLAKLAPNTGNDGLLVISNVQSTVFSAVPQKRDNNSRFVTTLDSRTRTTLKFYNYMHLIRILCQCRSMK